MYTELFKKSNPHNSYYYHYVHFDSNANTHSIDVPGGNALKNILIVGNTSTPYSISFEIYTSHSGFVPVPVSYDYEALGNNALITPNISSFAVFSSIQTSSLRISITNITPFSGSVYILFKVE